MSLTNDDFIKRASTIHKNFYNYLDEYKNSKEKIKIKCPLHGKFEQKPYSHLQGIGCPKCAIEKRANLCRKTDDTFIKQANDIHNYFYNYDKVVYKNTMDNIIITCPLHGDFKQSPQSHLKGYGCPGCTPRKENKSNSLFIEQATKLHNGKYKYFDDYKGAHTPIKINCTIHGDFLQTPNSHLKGRGCPNCQFSNSSKLERKWLDKLGIDIKYRNKTISIDGKKFKVDAYVPDTNTIYEFYGDYWHGNPNKKYNSDINMKSKTLFSELYQNTINRERYLISKGFNIISIWEDDFIKQK